MLEFARKQNKTQNDTSNHAGTKKVTSGPIATIPALQRKNSCACGGGCPRCLQAKHAHTNETGGNTAPSAVNEVLRSPGQPLDGSTREFMESRFEHDFSRVRVHTDSKAIQAAQTVNALAFTVGHNIAFAKGQYAPETLSGKRLLAHELTHVTQQHGNRGILQKFSTGGDSNDVHEREAEQNAGDITSGGPEQKACSKRGGCKNGQWKFDYDGCTFPAFLSGAFRASRFDPDNPAGGEDTHFATCTPGGRGCDRHDECYQTPGADKDKCDSVFKDDLIAICKESKGNSEVKKRCEKSVGIYSWIANNLAQKAFNDRQKEVGKCTMAIEYKTYFKNSKDLA